MWVKLIHDEPLDFEADARRFYGTTLDQMWETMDGPTFYGLLYRLSAYEGVVSARLQKLAGGEPEGEREEVEMDHAAFGGLIEHATV